MSLNQTIPCRVCKEETDFIGIYKILNKYDVKYFKCKNCLFIQTEKPYWLEEAYSSVITHSDIGLVQRNLDNVDTVRGVVEYFHRWDKSFLDYAGGYGLFVRMMRDKGYDFYREDQFCENLFAEHFDLEDSSQDEFEMVTAFEVFEHFVNPIEELKKILNYSSSVFCTTTLYPLQNNLTESRWDYLAPETGQHIAFYHQKTFEFLADKFNLNYYTNGSVYHLLTSKRIKYSLFKTLCSYRLRRLPLFFKPKRKSLLLDDYQKIREQ